MGYLGVVFALGAVAAAILHVAGKSEVNENTTVFFLILAIACAAVQVINDYRLIAFWETIYKPTTNKFP